MATKLPGDQDMNISVAHAINPRVLMRAPQNGIPPYVCQETPPPDPQDSVKIGDKPLTCRDNLIVASTLLGGAAVGGSLFLKFGNLSGGLGVNLFGVTAFGMIGSMAAGIFAIGIDSLNSKPDQAKQAHL